MRISYQIICDFWSQNKKILIIWQVIFLLLAGIYLATTPKTYEAYFQVRTAKILVDDKWNALKWARYTRRDLMSPQSYPANLVQACMGEDGNGIRRSLVNSIQIDVIDDSGGVMGISVRLVGKENATKCANLLAVSIVENSNAALAKRLADDGFSAPNTSKGRVNNYEKPVVTSQVQMSDSYVYPQNFKVFLAALLMGLAVAFATVILRERYRGK
jgi:capsular polysaccharide biosynthesis protein